MIIKPLLFLLVLATLALSQTNSSPIAGMTPEAMDMAITESYEKGRDARTPRKLLTEAIARGRIDLIKASFLNSHTAGETVNTIGGLPDGEIRRKSAIMMLRLPSTACWPKESPLLFSSARATGMVEPFTSTVPNILHGEVLQEEMVATQAARNRLADRLLAALIAQGTSISPEEKVLLESAPPQTLQQTASQPKRPATTAQVPKPVDAPTATSQPIRSTSPKAENLPRQYLWTAGSVLVFVTLAWLALRKRR